MGQKVNPLSLRLNLTKKWESRWFASKRDFAQYLAQDEKIRKLLRQKFPEGAIKNIVIFRNVKSVEVTIYTAKPGIIIGRSGSGMNDIKSLVEGACFSDNYSKKQQKIKLHVEEFRNIENSAQLVAENIAGQIEKRITPRRAMKQAIDKLKDKGLKGARVRASGRLGGAEIARSESISYGSIPLHSFKIDIDYAYVKALTNYGTVGIKVWLNLGEFDFGKEEEIEEREREKRRSS